MALPDYYEILQVFPRADIEVIQAAYSRLAGKYHPDRNIGDDSAERMMRLLNEAKDVLCHPARRLSYDAAREQANEPRQKQQPVAEAFASRNGYLELAWDGFSVEAWLKVQIDSGNVEKVRVAGKGTFMKRDLTPGNHQMRVWFILFSIDGAEAQISINSRETVLWRVGHGVWPNCKSAGPGDNRPLPSLIAFFNRLMVLPFTVLLLLAWPSKDYSGNPRFALFMMIFVIPLAVVTTLLDVYWRK